MKQIKTNKQKKKSILIDENTYNGFREFCKNKKFKMKPLLEDIIRRYVNTYEDLD